MAKRRKGNIVARLLTSRLFLIILIVIAILIAIAYARLYYEDYKVREEIESLQSEIQSLEHRELESLQLLEFVKTDDFVDRAAREQLEMKAPGENVVVINNRETAKITKTAEHAKTVDISNPKKWWLHFTHKL